MIVAVISFISNSVSSYLNNKFSLNENDKREGTDLITQNLLKKIYLFMMFNSLANKLTAGQIDYFTKVLLMPSEDKESNYD